MHFGCKMPKKQWVKSNERRQKEADPKSVFTMKCMGQLSVKSKPHKLSQCVYLWYTLETGNERVPAKCYSVCQIQEATILPFFLSFFLSSLLFPHLQDHDFNADCGLFLNPRCKGQILSANNLGQMQNTANTLSLFEYLL